MNDDRMKYGTEFTSVKVHQSPGGNSSLSLAWEPPRRKAPPQQRGQSWDNPPQQERAPVRNQQRGYAEPRAAEPRANPRAYAPPARGYQDPEPAYDRWREEPPQYEPEEPRRRGYEDQRAEPRSDMRGAGRFDRGPDMYEGRGERLEGRQDRFEGRQDRYEGGGQFGGQEGRMPQPRARAERPREAQGYDRAEYGEQDYDPRPPRPQYNQGREQPQAKGNVHTSVKVREPPGGRSNFIFG